MEIAALPSCEKSLFAGAKVTIFLKKIHPGNPKPDWRPVLPPGKQPTRTERAKIRPGVQRLHSR